MLDGVLFAQFFVLRLHQVLVPPLAFFRLFVQTVLIVLRLPHLHLSLPLPRLFFDPHLAVVSDPPDAIQLALVRLPLVREPFSGGILVFPELSAEPHAMEHLRVGSDLHPFHLVLAEHG